ncbi:hypothetical protein TrVFT333_011075 [Trichoderma virens FT-333]|nr:hypothetical protein TrVFT333_011075 [Trichoderma virens FT-333]
MAKRLKSDTYPPKTTPPQLELIPAKSDLARDHAITKTKASCSFISAHLTATGSGYSDMSSRGNSKNEDQGSSTPDAMADYDLSRSIQPAVGMRQGLPNYGDPHFSLFLRKVFIKALGYSEDALSRPIIGIINTYSGFNPCHGNVPQLIEAAKRESS